MEVQAIVDRVTAALGGAPERIGEFIADPRSFAEGVVGELPADLDITQLADGVQDRLSSLDFVGYDLSSIADGGLGQLRGEDVSETVAAAGDGAVAAAGDAVAAATGAAGEAASAATVAVNEAATAASSAATDAADFAATAAEDAAIAAEEAASSLGDLPNITEAVDFGALTDSLPDGLGDIVSGVADSLAGGSSEKSGGIGDIVGGLLGGLFGKK